MTRILQYQVEEKDDGKCIDMFLKEKGYTRAIIIDLKKTELGIRKNGVWAYVNEKVHTGDLIETCLQELESSANIIPMEGNLDIVFEDEDILIVNKPSDTPIHPSINNYNNTLANMIAYYFKSKGEEHIFRCINRLDRDTTGVTILAKNALSAAILSEQVRERTLSRTYLALVEGVTKEVGIIDLPIGREEETIIKRRVDMVDGKRAVTHYQRLAIMEVEGQKVSLLELKLETGRTHQIRVHMSYIGHPLLGDYLYNNNEENKLLTRQALHSAKLSFYHPITGEAMEVTAPLPKDMAEIVESQVQTIYSQFSNSNI